MRIEILKNAMDKLGINIPKEETKKKMFLFDDKLFVTEDDIADYIKDNQEKFIEGVIKDNLDDEINEIIGEKAEEVEI